VGHHRLGIVVLIALVLAAPAAAKRSPTKAETTAIRAALLHEHVVSARISTRDPRYAAAVLSHGVAILHRTYSAWWVVARGSSLHCSVAPASVLADLNVPCTPPDGSAWISNCGPLASAPAELVLACGDGNYYLTGLHWQAWGTTSATASGTAHLNDCTPYCAAGHFHTYPVRVVATKRARCGAAVYYARLEVTYPGRRPPGQKGHLADSLPC
jgi:hypothetical protein